MQSLYSLESMNTEGQLLKSLDTDDPVRMLDQKLRNTSNNFAASLLYIVKIAQYAEIDAGNKAAKFLPNDRDLNVSTKISGNVYLWKLLENETFKEKIKQDKLDAYINEEWVRKLYVKLIETERYKAYTLDETRDDEEERKMMVYIWKHVLSKDENFQDILSDEWIGYAEDKALNRTVVDFYFKNPDGFNFLSFLSKEKEKYAKELLKSVIDREDYLMEIIRPKLKNWDPERVAMIDMVLLKMGVAEFLYFPTIPTKVTINEYIEIAKDFSTEDSGKFVNAVLDNVVKDLNKEKMIRKVDRDN